MKVHLVKLSDVIGNTYVGIKYYGGVLDDIIDTWKSSFNINDGDEKGQLESSITNQQKRDNFIHHTTVCNVMDFNKLSTSEVIGLFDSVGEIFEINILGIGKAENIKKGNIVNFVVIECEELQELRKRIGLKPIDLHITIGFDKKDVFGVSKGKDSIFLDL